jgi:hypothetical protein
MKFGDVFANCICNRRLRSPLEGYNQLTRHYFQRFQAFLSPRRLWRRGQSVIFDLPHDNLIARPGFLALHQGSRKY